MPAHPDVVWSASCQTTGSTRRYLDVTRPTTTSRSPSRKYLNAPNTQSDKIAGSNVFAGSMIAPEVFHRVNFPNFKRKNVRVGNFVKNRPHAARAKPLLATQDVQNKIDKNVAFPTNLRQVRSSSVASNSIGYKTISSDPGIAVENRTPRQNSSPLTQIVQSQTVTPRISSISRENSRVEMSTLPKPTATVETVAKIFYGGKLQQFKEDISNADSSDADKTQQHRFKVHQSWRKAVDTVINNPERQESRVRNEQIFVNTLSLPKKFTHQELAARVVTAMKNPPSRTFPEFIDSDVTRKSLLQPKERAHSAPLLVRGAMRREIQRRFSSEAWYQKALATLREIPAYVSRVEDESSNDLEEIAKRLCRTTAASRAREAATNKVVYKEPESREDIHGHAQKPRPKSVTPAMIRSMHRFKGEKQVQGPDLQETVKRLSACEPGKIPDCKRIAPPDASRHVGIMNTLSWKGRDLFQREGVNTAGLEALVLHMNGR